MWAFKQRRLLRFNLVLKDPTIYRLADLILVVSGYGEKDLVSLVEETKN